MLRAERIARRFADGSSGRPSCSSTGGGSAFRTSEQYPTGARRNRGSPATPPSIHQFAYPGRYRRVAAGNSEVAGVPRRSEEVLVAIQTAEQFTQLQVRVPRDLHDEVKRAAEAADLSLAQVMRRALRQWVDQSKR